jgi:hypothetical protein
VIAIAPIPLLAHQTVFIDCTLIRISQSVSAEVV